MMTMTSPPLQPRDRVASPELRRMVERIVRKRIPPHEVDDVVQTVLCDAVAARELPTEEDSLKRWLAGVARHKVADFYRKRGKTQQVELPEQLEAEPAPLEAHEWVNWADKQVEGNDEARRTLGWMAREGSGEKLAHIAKDESLPPAQVRQRVSRLRRMMRQRWMAELAAVAGVGVVALLAWFLLRDDREVAKPTPVPELSPTASARPLDPRLERGRMQRKLALEVCNKSRAHDEWHRCLRLLDEAAESDPEGDKAVGVQAVRGRARGELALPDPSDDSDSPSPSAEVPFQAPPTSTSLPPTKGRRDKTSAPLKRPTKTSTLNVPKAGPLNVESNAPIQQMKGPTKAKPRPTKVAPQNKASKSPPVKPSPDNEPVLNAAPEQMQQMTAPKKKK